MRRPYLKGFLILFLLSICLSFFRVYILGHNSEPFDLFHFLPGLLFNETIEGIFPNYPDILIFIPIAITDGILGIIVVVLCIKLFFKYNQNNNRIFYLIIFITFCITQWIIFNYIPIFKP